MGMQYIGRPDMFTGDRGAYIIKKQRLKYDSLEKLVQKYYRGKSYFSLKSKIWCLSYSRYAFGYGYAYRKMPGQKRRSSGKAFY